MIQRYVAKISGPLLDRIDIHIEVPAVQYKELRGGAAAEGSAQIRARVMAARERQRARFTIASRAWFDLMMRTDPATLTDVQRAARFLYLTKNTYASLIRRRNYGTNVTQPPPFNPERLPEILEETRKRLARVQIENLPYEAVLRRYDRPTTLFYLDPPYYARKLYRYNLDHADFVKMAERLRGLKGKFVLSLNDVPQVREIFKAFTIRGVDLHYTAQKVAGKRFKEVLITNFLARVRAASARPRAEVEREIEERHRTLHRSADHVLDAWD